VLLNPEIGADMASHNYPVGQRYYSHQILESQLALLMTQCLGV
jgi:hypothetical protein